jgi:hypothetical protein
MGSAAVVVVRATTETFLVSPQSHHSIQRRNCTDSIVALVAKALMKYFYFLECGDTVGSLFCRFWPELGPFRAKSCGSSKGALIL